MVDKAVHFDIPVDDGDRAVRFYSQAFGWDLQRWGGMDYWPMAPADGPGIGGALGMRSDEAPGVVLYLGVDDIDAALERVEAAGGRRLGDKAAIPTVGWTAQFQDTEGNRMGLFQSDEGTPAG